MPTRDDRFNDDVPGSKYRFFRLRRPSVNGLALVYLAVPNLLFLLTWTRPVVGILIAIIAVIAMGNTFRSAMQGAKFEQPLRKSALAVITIVALVWTAFGGAGHFGFANADWGLRDALYGDLIRYEWPVAYQMANGSTGILRTAMAYFLAPALVASVAGVAHADVLLFLWTALGVGIFFALLPVPRSRSGHEWLVPLLLVVMFSGMDALASWIYNFHNWPEFPRHLEWWTIRFQYSSFSTQLFWVPNHSIAAWIGAAIVFRHHCGQGDLDLVVLVMAMLLLWSPFAFLGCAPFAVASAIRVYRFRGVHGISPLSGIASISLLVPIAVLMTSSIGGISGGSTRLPGGVENPFPELLSVYFLFVMMEFGIIVVVLRSLVDKNREMLWLSAGILLALPFVRFGPGNDIVTRASIPALTILCLFAVVAATQEGNGNRRLVPSMIFAAILGIGSVTAAHEIGRTVLLDRWTPDYGRTMREQQGGLPPHYVGKFSGSLVEWIVRVPKSLH